jgi:archaellum component FlaF (FlaF/FlaG flagellin family)
MWIPCQRGEEVILIYICIASAVILAIIKALYDLDTEHIKKQNKRLKEENQRLVDKHNDLVERFNTLRVSNKEYVDMIIERNDKIIELNDKVNTLKNGRYVTQLFENIKPKGAGKDAN